jgi:N-methylhydantoinase A
VVGRGIPDTPRAGLAANAEQPQGVFIAEPVRRAYFGPVHGWRDTNVLNRADLAEPRMGPCIVEEYDATCIVPPGATASLDRFGNIAIDLAPAAPEKTSSRGEQFDAP